MINALRRFISVRGYPEQIRSDRGSNFTKADKELKEAIEGWNEHKINNFCGQKKIEWIFNPPSVSHMGWYVGADDTFCAADPKGHFKGATGL